jgi:DNA-binding MarR family transcriptional regulator
MHTKIPSKKPHSSRDIAYAISLFFAVRRIMRTALAKNKQFDPSTWLRIETMKFIAENDDSKMKDIAEYLCITAPSATSLVRGLIESGTVISRMDPSDRRASRLILTKKGKTELKKTIANGLKVFSSLFSVLSKAELTAFTQALERIKKESGGQ